VKEFSATHSSAEGRNLGGFTSFGPRGKSVITWNGETTEGIDPIDAILATLDRIQFVQKTTSASEPNAKLLVKLLQAVEEFDGKPPSIGGDLNNLIPKE
jgi:hypothetical protein